MYTCTKCNNKFQREDLDYISVQYGECWGYPAYKREWCCPVCKGEVMEDEE